MNRSPISFIFLFFSFGYLNGMNNFNDLDLNDKAKRKQNENLHIPILHPISVISIHDNNKSPITLESID